MLSVPFDLSGSQRATLDAYVAELERLNRRVNLVARPASRADLERHVRHCLALAAKPFPHGATVVDWGSGGGLPAVPLAVAFPDLEVVAVDTVGKKTETVKLVSRRLDITNLAAWNGRAETYDGPAPHVSVSRATAPLATLWAWHTRVCQPIDLEGDVWSGLVCLKGGDLEGEIAQLHEVAPDVEVTVSGLEDVLGPEWSDKSIVQVTGL
ncbi:16S rRNA (guanine(527)-N(7))-methyltransferase RsmG [Rubrivirga sp.]|uniref:16S rRNA (guanine(527)-N(7))-methyltransferase RsmG n=1 Tax=Rubrivirga sp. TaxID=1885344 RepID=UPI003C707F67